MGALDLKLARSGSKVGLPNTDTSELIQANIKIAVDAHMNEKNARARVIGAPLEEKIAMNDRTGLYPHNPCCIASGGAPRARPNNGSKYIVLLS
ncbi:hypothetical protein M1146_05905 [Patescibacteria group bacterium]|nr:hypothetical protein [Patescibacteria group bacterium]